MKLSIFFGIKKNYGSYKCLQVWLLFATWNHIIALNVCNHITMYVFTNPSAQAGCDTASIFYVEFNRFEFTVLFLQD